jgi:hypothetical protein
MLCYLLRIVLHHIIHTELVILQVQVAVLRDQCRDALLAIVVSILDLEAIARMIESASGQSS